MVAVETGNRRNVAKLIVRGATNIDEALEESRRLRKHAVTAAVLLIKAAMENDSVLILKLLGEITDGLETKIQLKEDDNLSELQHCCSQSN